MSVAGGQRKLKGAADKLGAEFHLSLRRRPSLQMKIIEFVPGERIVWLVLDNYFNFTEDKTEWKDTQVIFEVCRKGDHRKSVSPLGSSSRM